MHLWMNKDTITARRFVIAVILIVNTLVLLLRQGLTSVPFLFFSVIDKALRNFVHVKKNRWEQKEFCCSHVTTFTPSKLYAKNHTKIRFGHLIADNFVSSTSSFVNCKELDPVNL